MRKIKIIMLVLIIFVLAGCGSKKSLTSHEFIKIMRANNYYVVDSKDEFSEYDYIKEAYIATNSKTNYQIEFYILQDVENSKAFYKLNKNIFEASKIDGYSAIEQNLYNYNKFALTTDHKYKIISRIDNSVIYLNVDDIYKKEIKSILKKIGY